MLEERNAKAIKDIQETVQQAMGIEQQAFKDSESQLLKVIDDRFYGLTVEIQDVRRRREDTEVRLVNEREENVAKIEHMIAVEQTIQYVVTGLTRCAERIVKAAVYRRRWVETHCCCRSCLTCSLGLACVCVGGV